MKKFFPILFLLCFSLTFFFSCSNSDSNGDDGDTPVSYTIDEKTWNETMKGLPFITDSKSSFTFKDYKIYYDGDIELELIMQKDGLKLKSESFYTGGIYYSMWDFSGYESTGKSKKYYCFNEKYDDWLYWYFTEGYASNAFQFISVGAELYDVFVANADSMPRFDELRFENDTYSFIRENMGEFDEDTYRFEFIFEDNKLASVKVWVLDEDIDEETDETTSEWELETYFTLSDWGTTKIELPDTYSLDEMGFDEMEDYLFSLCYDLGREQRYTYYGWDHDENAAWIEFVYSGLIYYKYDEEAEESKYLIKTGERIRSDIIKYFIEQNIEHFSEIEDLSEQITDPKCIYLGRFTEGNQYYIEIIEEQAFSQADEKAPIFTVRVRKPNNQ